jgi:hypothetical protein
MPSQILLLVAWVPWVKILANTCCFGAEFDVYSLDQVKQDAELATRELQAITTTF